MSRMIFAALAIFGWCAVLAALVTQPGCASYRETAKTALDEAATTANTLRVAVETSETVLYGVCEAVQLEILESSATVEEADARLGPVQVKCAAAWAVFDEFKLTFTELTFTLEHARATLDAPDIAKVSMLIARLIRHAKDFEGHVTLLLHEYGQSN